MLHFYFKFIIIKIKFINKYYFISYKKAERNSANTAEFLFHNFF